MKLSPVFALLFSLTFFVCGQSHASQIKLLPTDGNAADYFGFSVAIDGTTALVGAYKADIKSVPDVGAAYVYTLGDDGWHKQAKLVVDPFYANDTAAGSLALHDNFAMVGVSRRDDKGENSGAVFAFEREGKTWSQKQILTAIDAQPGDVFGQSIAMTDDFLVVGAPHSDSPQKDSGSAYVFIRDSNQWRYQTKLTAHDGAEGDLFGISVAIDGYTILIGADLNDERAEKAGAVYAFVYSGDKWEQQGKLMANDGGHTDIFGVRVALSGDTALISARRDDIEGVGVDAGSAYIFERTDDQWRQTQKLVAPNANEDDRFGRGVALNNHLALVSAMHDDDKDTNAGAVYVYKKQQDGWFLSSKILATDGKAEDKLGWNLALSNTTAIVATPHSDDNGDASGAVYIVDIVN